MGLEPLTPQRRRAMTRQHLLDAAAIVFTRNGFHGSSLDEVAATAGFTKGAVYSNFKSKDDLFLALLDDRQERQAAAFERELDAGPRDEADELPRIRELVSKMWDDDWSVLYLEFVLYAARNPKARSKLAASTRKVHEHIERMIETGYVRAGTTPRFPPHSLATISMAIFDGLGIDRIVDPSTVTDETLHMILTFLYSSIGVDAEPNSRPPQPSE
jgi:AcrR family transcriptional regulator